MPSSESRNLQPGAERVPADTIGAFMGEPRLLVAGARRGVLAERTLAVKDLFDVAGTVTGAGNPTFAAGRSPAAANAPAVEALVRAGASVVGKTITDELAYSLAGTNVHYGTPRNVNAPGRIPGGSSAGSAAAVGAGLVDLALGTDTGGSIRVPASYCGVYGWRPTHGAVSADGVVPLAPSFDSIGLFAGDPYLLATAAEVLLSTAASPAPAVLAIRLALIAEALPGMPDGIAAALGQLAARLGTTGDASQVELGIDLDRAGGVFRTLQGAEAWAAHGAWIIAAQPRFGPGIAARFRAASLVTADQVAVAQPERQRITELMQAATADGTILVMPAAHGAAPPIDASAEATERQRAQNLRLTCLAGLARLPVVVAPLLHTEGMPLGVAFVGASGSDLRLLASVEQLVAQLAVEP
ncbi:MAG: Amidase [Ilumatobacteraceae bacterium]|nr:Amidase [Ilumatobacteraceae bacterium]